MMMRQNMARESSEPITSNVHLRQSKMSNNSEVQYERLIRLPEVMRLTGLKRSSLYLKITQSAFPAPVKIGQRAVAWKLSEVEDYIQERVQARVLHGGASCKV